MFRTFVRRFKRSKTAVLGLILLSIMFSSAILAPLYPHKYTETNLNNNLAAPSISHPMGTDRLGRDIFARVLHGGRVSLAVGFIAVGISATIGILIGSTAGYFGGMVDNILMRFTEVVMVFPQLFLILTVLAVVKGGGIMLVMAIIGLTGWTGICRLTRGEFLSLRERDYTYAARSLGANDLRIIFKHILPNAMAPLIVSITLGVGGAILTETTLSFLGIGVRPPDPSWGNVLSDGRQYLTRAPWMSTYPGIFIFVTILGYNFLGDGLRDALDPRLKQ
ncbi:ABC transporter permease [Alkalicella caledoniensis]|uniref:ABC transporter permease n=2 Tax=Alkalicella caledoniensis TaxID=2731377 RepID=A0A7G9WDE3_ALKCA|nr:ABC transporter permease [Alkalicella caledoniensis]